ncbi:MAG: cation:proton antiporter subunit C [Chloroflexi bacterium]|nr:cation:proton antiporter subunit C [Chloroflexota bacterium]MCK4580506.1 cation:proton antiporter subunit C [Dehalococcoidia bacterium]
MTASTSYNVPFLAVVALAGIAFYIILFQRNLIKLVMGIVILESGVNLFLVSLGYRSGGIAPIFTHAPEGIMVLPVPQALTLTSIVIGVATTALMLSMIMLIYRHTGDIDAEKSRSLKG